MIANGYGFFQCVTDTAVETVIEKFHSIKTRRRI
jgi:hypothetical protein